MPTVNVYNQSGKKVSEVLLNEKVFGITPNQQVLFEVVNAQRAALRQGTHKTKKRDEVRGGGRKPWRQKGTGRARHGSIRSPQWKGGGVVFGPQPRSYNVKLNQKVRQLALRSALSYHVLQNGLLVVEDVKFEMPKTKSFIEFLNNLKLNGKTILLGVNVAENVFLSAGNIPYADVREANQASVYELLKFNNVILTKDAVKYYEEKLG